MVWRSPHCTSTSGRNSVANLIRGAGAMAHRNEELVRRGYEAFNNADVETLRQVFGDTTVFHEPGRRSCWRPRPATTAPPTPSRSAAPTAARSRSTSTRASRSSARSPTRTGSSHKDRPTLEATTALGIGRGLLDPGELACDSLGVGPLGPRLASEGVSLRLFYEKEPVQSLGPAERP